MIKESITELRFRYNDKKDKLVRVYVLEHEDGAVLPVVYMTDGQNLFEDDDVPFGCWYTREAVRAEYEASGRSAVIVGIHNDDGPLERANELLPASVGRLMCPEEVLKTLTPGGDGFVDFVTDTVMPAVEARFPVKKGRASTAFCGSSMGGLMAYYIVLRRPELFCAGGVFSPAFMYFDPADIVAFTNKRMQPDMPLLYIYTGAGGPMEKMIYQSTEAVYDGLSEFYPPEKLVEVALPDQPHHEKAWEPIFRDFLHSFLNRTDL